MRRHSAVVLLTSTWAPAVALVAMSLSQAILFGQRGMPWRGEFFWTAQWIESNSFPALIAAAVAVSFDAVRVFTPDRLNLVALDDLRRPTLSAYLEMVTLGLSVPYFAALAVGATKWPDILEIAGLWSLAHALVAFLSIVAILVVVLAIGVALGMAGLAVGPMVGIALGYVAMSQEGLMLLGASTGSMLGFEPAALTLATQFVTAVATIWGLSVLILNWPDRSETTSRRRHLSVVFGVAALLGLSGGLNLTPYMPTLRGELECLGTPGGPEVTACVSYEHGRLLPALQERLREVREAGERYGVGSTLPDVVLEDFTLTRAGLDSLIGFPQDLGTVAYWRPSVEELAAPDAGISRESFVGALATPLLCPQLRAENPPSMGFWDEVAARSDALLTMVDQSATDADRQAAAKIWARSAQAFSACEFQ
ncbi:hypothetical protein [Trueperella abortisuis]|uniref:ABC transporter permease n=1 Tax=Trueperella abortisuis TaxID=445930 RepID=A0ABT9PL96_9ACTO|nr:hypothetical protein [Trueperella abortisuis]MDP9833487.1 hypothetical protein [Trueperella abortisuis]